MIKNVPDELKYLPELAMKIWYEGESHSIPEADPERLRGYLINEIKKQGLIIHRVTISA